MTENAVIRYRAILNSASARNKSGLPNNVWAMLALLDERDGQHWHDRDRYGELVKAQNKRIDDLSSRLHRLETKGDSA